MHDSMIVKVGDSGKRSSYELGSVALVVAAFPTNSVEELPTQREVRHEVHCSAPFSVTNLNERLASHVRLFIVSK